MKALIELKIPKNKIARLYLDNPTKKANIINEQFVSELTDILGTLDEQKADLKGLIILSKKDKMFIAGADVEEIRSIDDPQLAFEKSRSGQILIERLEKLPFPTAAAINGTCVGGGLELSLACNYLLGTDDASMALPEVKLGIIPGWGGTQRLPKRVGLIKAIEMITTGKTLRAKDALKIGLLDGITLPEDLESLCERMVLGQVKPKKPKVNTVNSMLERFSFSRKQIIFAKARQQILQATKGNYPAPIAALDVLEKTFGSSHRLAYEIEAQKLAETLTSSVSKNLVKLFLEMEIARKKTFSEKALELSEVGILGAGVMGGGIAHAFISKGIAVKVKDIASKSIATAFHTASNLLGRSSRFKKNRSDLEKHLLMFSPTQEYKSFKNCPLIIEAVVEDIQVKKSVFQELEKSITKKTIIGSNTSALSITDMASVLKYPQRMIGIHFFNPVNKMPLVELVLGEETDEKTLAQTYYAMVGIGKTPIVVKDRPGFLVNRILVLYLIEALRMAHEGISIEAIEKAAKSFGFPMGPFELVDEVGIDVAEKVGQFLCDSYEHFPQAPDVLRPFIQSKYLGKKSKKGFYIHGKKKELNRTFIEKQFPSKLPATHLEQIETRLIYLLLNECQRCLDEHIVADEKELDLGMILGTGFPPFKGGPSKVIQEIGPEKLKNRLQELEQMHGKHYQSCF